MQTSVCVMSVEAPKLYFRPSETPDSRGGPGIGYTQCAPAVATPYTVDSDIVPGRFNVLLNYLCHSVT